MNCLPPLRLCAAVTAQPSAPLCPPPRQLLAIFCIPKNNHLLHSLRRMRAQRPCPCCPMCTTLPLPMVVLVHPPTPPRLLLLSPPSAYMPCPASPLHRASCQPLSHGAAAAEGVGCNPHCASKTAPQPLSTAPPALALPLDGICCPTAACLSAGFDWEGLGLPAYLCPTCTPC